MEIALIVVIVASWLGLCFSIGLIDQFFGVFTICISATYFFVSAAFGYFLVKRYQAKCPQCKKSAALEQVHELDSRYSFALRAIDSWKIKHITKVIASGTFPPHKEVWREDTWVEHYKCKYCGYIRSRYRTTSKKIS